MIGMGTGDHQMSRLWLPTPKAIHTRAVTVTATVRRRVGGVGIDCACVHYRRIGHLKSPPHLQHRPPPRRRARVRAAMARDGA